MIPQLPFWDESAPFPVAKPWVVFRSVGLLLDREYGHVLWVSLPISVISKISIKQRVQNEKGQWGNQINVSEIYA